MHYYTGLTAGVCMSKNDVFVCPTANSSANVICDTTKCPLHGLSVAPVMRQQKISGVSSIFQKRPTSGPIDYSILQLVPIWPNPGQLVVGGGGDGGSPTSHIELFPRSSFAGCSTVPALPHSRFGLSLSLLRGGRLVVCGGKFEHRKLDSCLSWVAGNSGWTAFSSMRWYMAQKRCCRERNSSVHFISFHVLGN